jgi:hypothetical protein
LDWGRRRDGHGAASRAAEPQLRVGGVASGDPLYRQHRPPVGSSGLLVRFFDSAFFREWIAVSYLYKHDHDGVRDYLYKHCIHWFLIPTNFLIEFSDLRAHNHSRIRAKNMFRKIQLCQIHIVCLDC